MGDITLGLFGGACIGALIAIPALGDGRWKLWLTFTITTTLIGGIVTTHHAIKRSESYCEQYVNTKQTIEGSIENVDLTGMERLDLVNTAIEHNQKLIEKQFNAKQWYGFTITDKVLELEPINVVGDNE